MLSFNKFVQQEINGSQFFKENKEKLTLRIFFNSSSVKKKTFWPNFDATIIRRTMDEREQLRIELKQQLALAHFAPNAISSDGNFATWIKLWQQVNRVNILAAKWSKFRVLWRWNSG